MKSYNMEVSKKVTDKAGNGSYEKVGEIVVPIFPLSDFGLEVEPVAGTARAEVQKARSISEDADEGLDVYSDERVQYVYDALVAATKADARNKLVSSTATLKAGNRIADSVAELIAKAERSGAALALNREFLSSFSAYLSGKSGKSAVVQALYNGLVKNRQSITLSTQARRDGLLAQIEAYTAQATPEEVEKYASILTTIGELCSAELEDLDADL